MKSVTRNLVALLLVTLANGAWAHEPMGHSCSAPARPANDQDDVLWQRFLDDIDVFRNCVTRTKERHEDAVSQHQDAARAAVESWNAFVRTSLNAPEDFPWEGERDEGDQSKRNVP
jgi:hypothetical protein